jgi:hypothetical protein
MHDEPDARDRLQDDGGQREEEIREDRGPCGKVPRGRLRLASSTEEKERDAETRAEQNRRGENMQCLDGEIAAYVIAPRLALLGHRRSIRFHTGASELEL